MADKMIEKTDKFENTMKTINEDLLKINQKLIFIKKEKEESIQNLRRTCEMVQKAKLDLMSLPDALAEMNIINDTMKKIDTLSKADEETMLQNAEQEAKLKRTISNLENVLEQQIKKRDQNQEGDLKNNSTGKRYVNANLEMDIRGLNIELQYNRATLLDLENKKLNFEQVKALEKEVMLVNMLRDMRS